MFRRLALLSVILGTLACGGGRETEPVFVRASLAAQRFTLANGLDVILHPDPSFRSVAVNVRYDVGSKHDPSGSSGLAHLIEHLTFRTKPDGKQDAFALLEQAGSSSHNATTSTDATCYFETVPSQELPLALFIEAARMARPLDGVDEEIFGVERDVVRNERRQRVDNVPYGNLDDNAVYLLFDGHPYGIPTVGFAEDLERVTLLDARRFVASHYRPNNATLVVAGSFDPRRATALVHELFDAIPGAPVLASPEIPRPAWARENLHRRVDVGTDAPAVVLAWRAPPAGYRGWHEMVLAAQIVGGRTKYRMGEAVRRIWAEVVSMDAASVFLVHAELAKTANPDDVVEKIEDELEELADSGVDVLLGGQKSHLLASETLALENLEHRGEVLQTFVARYGDPNSIQAELHEFSVVSRSDLASAVDRWLRQGWRVRVDGRPKPGAPKAGAWVVTPRGAGEGSSRGEAARRRPRRTR